MNTCACEPNADGGCAHWKLVTDECELRAGMTVDDRRCSQCGSDHRVVLFRRYTASQYVRRPGGGIMPSVSSYSWDTAPIPHPGSECGSVEFGRSVINKTLFVLVVSADEPAAVETKRKEVVG